MVSSLSFLKSMELVQKDQEKWNRKGGKANSGMCGGADTDINT